jgi:jasmonate ZIM domain-containing protein
LEAERAQPQLTIFYDGKTTVFDDFPADKADQLMQLAGSILTPAATTSRHTISWQVCITN